MVTFGRTGDVALPEIEIVTWLELFCQAHTLKLGGVNTRKKINVTFSSGIDIKN